MSISSAFKKSLKEVQTWYYTQMGKKAPRATCHEPHANSGISQLAVKRVARVV
jgi:hypothetical protein